MCCARASRTALGYYRPMTGEHLGDLNVPSRLLLGPGPSNVHPRVYRAMMTPVIGYLDPAFIQLLDDTQRPLRTVFRTENDLTMAVSGTGTWSGLP